MPNRHLKWIIENGKWKIINGAKNCTLHFYKIRSILNNITLENYLKQLSIFNYPFSFKVFDGLMTVKHLKKANPRSARLRGSLKGPLLSSIIIFRFLSNRT